jgi:hypothetical protein
MYGRLIGAGTTSSPTPSAAGSPYARRRTTRPCATVVAGVFDGPEGSGIEEPALEPAHAVRLMRRASTTRADVPGRRCGRAPHVIPSARRLDDATRLRM